MDGILVIDKPYGITSHDVIDQLRKKYKQKKFGHTGTLDPNATGVLVVLCGRACKALQFLENQDKTYVAQMKLGLQTTTDDIWGEIEQEQEVVLINDLQDLLDTMIGPQKQLVPRTSAKKIGGKKLYEYQREGKEVPKVYADVTIYDFKVLDEQKMEFEVQCSSGTYVRSICRDAALKSGNLGVMSSLKRIKAGGFTIEQAEPLDKKEHTLIPLEKAFDNWEKVEYEPIADILNGKRIQCNAKNNLIAIMHEGKILAIYEREKEKTYRSKRGLW